MKILIQGRVIVSCPKPGGGGGGRVPYGARKSQGPPYLGVTSRLTATGGGAIVQPITGAPSIRVPSA